MPTRRLTLRSALSIKDSDTQKKPVKWAENNISEGFTVFDLPEAHRKKMRTSNICENINRQIKRRAKVLGGFPNEDSLLRLVTAVLIGICVTRETGNSYIPPNK